MGNPKRATSKVKAPIVGLLTIELHFPGARSLKEKRMVVKSIKDRLRRKFNVAVAETGYQDLWQRAVLSVVSVGSARHIVESTLEAMDRDLEERHSSELLGTSFELIESGFGSEKDWSHEQEG